MKHAKYIFYFMVLIFLGCEKKSIQPIDYDEPMLLGESILYLNKNIEEYNISFEKSNDLYVLSFNQRDTIEGGIVINALSFIFKDTSSGIYELSSSELIEDNKIKTIFGQIVLIDNEGYSYELLENENNFFEIHEMNENEELIKCHFQVCFQRTSRNGQRLDFPKELLFQALVYESF